MFHRHSIRACAAAFALCAGAAGAQQPDPNNPYGQPQQYQQPYPQQQYQQPYQQPYGQPQYGQPKQPYGQQQQPYADPNPQQQQDSYGDADPDIDGYDATTDVYYDNVAARGYDDGYDPNAYQQFEGALSPWEQIGAGTESTPEAFRLKAPVPPLKADEKLA